AALALAGALRRYVRSSAFTFFGVLAAGVTWLALYLVIGGLDDFPSLAIGRWGIWLALLGLTTLPAALLVDAHEFRRIRELGRRRAKQRDAAPILCGSLAWMGLGASATAFIAPGWYLFRAVGDADPDPAHQAWAFGVNGLLLIAVMVLLGRRHTPLRRRIAEVLRWILPSHLMAPLLFMEIDETFDAWIPWLVLLPLLAVGFCFASALRQWKPFLISGLVYLAVWYARCFVRIETELAAEHAWRITLTIAALILGPGLMFLAWKAPAWIARHRLRKWERLSTLRAGPRAGRSWR
ncbi:MAG: hypothetical protein K8E66_08195, partial [Phycisphaerales bacterium]|nr:hypothetical protein [Phycisphaerales bacterium]